MKEVKIHVYCDLCYREAQMRVEAETTSPITVPGFKSMTLDLCERHEKEVLGQLRDLLNEKGSRPSIEELNTPRIVRERAPAATGAQPIKRWQCPLPNCGLELNRGSAIGHIYRVHVGTDRPEQPASCPDCSFPDGRTVEAKVMAKHRAQMHGLDVVSDALAAATAKMAKVS